MSEVDDGARGEIGIVITAVERGAGRVRVVFDDVRAKGDAARRLRRPPLQSAFDLAQRLLVATALPGKAAIDALHISLAAVHGMEYLLTWNCTHIANAERRPQIEAICRQAGWRPPVICTPLELLKEESS